MRLYLAGTVVGVCSLVGCLSDPDSGTSIDGGTSIDASADVIDAGESGGPDAAPVGPGSEFPPAGANLLVEDIWSGDLNGDAIDDLVVLNRSTVDQSFGAYVLYGQQGIGVTEFHAYLDTGTREPMAVTAIQATGDANLELLVYAVDFATPATDDNSGFVLGYEAVSATEFAAQPVTNAVSRVDKVYVQPVESESPAGITAGRFDPDADVPGMVVGVHTGVFQLVPQSWDTFGDAVPVMLRENVPMSGLVTIPSQTAGLDDVIGFEHAEAVRWFVNDGAGSLVGQIPLASLDPGIQQAVVLDGDGTGPLDVLGVGDQSVQLVLTGNPGSGHVWHGASFIDGLIGSMTDIEVVDADGDARPEVVLVGAQCADVSRPCAVLFPDVFVDGDGDLTSSELDDSFPFAPGYVPKKLASGDFDGDGSGELIVVAQNGALQCLRIVAGQLEECN